MTTPTLYAIATKRGEVEVGLQLDPEQVAAAVAGRPVRLRLDLEEADDLVVKLEDALEVAGAWTARQRGAAA